MTWSRSYASTLSSVSVRTTSDGGFVMTSWGERVTKGDVAGQPEWEKTSVPIGYLYAGGGLIQQTRDGGYIVSGSAIRLGGNDPWLLKLDPTGSGQWSQAYGGGGFLSVQQTSDSGYIVVGSAN